MSIEEKRNMFLKHCDEWRLYPHDPHDVNEWGFVNPSTQFNFSLFCLTLGLKNE